MDFLEFPPFPGHLVQQLTRSLSFLTEVVQLASSCEQRNAAWSQPLRRYDITAHAQTPADLYALETFFHAVKGRWLPFRFKDRLDFSSAQGSSRITASDQVVSRGDGLQRAFQLIKTVRVGELEQTRLIQKPVSDTVVVAIDGSEVQEIAIDAATGVITFLEAPAPDALITAGFAFDVPCRFDSDQLAISFQPPDLGSVTFSLVEVRLPHASLIPTPEQPEDCPDATTF